MFCNTILVYTIQSLNTIFKEIQQWNVTEVRNINKIHLYTNCEAYQSYISIHYLCSFKLYPKK